MTTHFEWMVALRYLSAKRKQAVISVITIISICGIAAGVMALIIALAINNGFRSTLQNSLLSATAHVNVLEREPQYGIENWKELIPKLRQVPHVIDVTPGLYGQVALKGPLVGSGAVLKGVPLGPTDPVPEILAHLKKGSIEGLQNNSGVPGIIIGAKLAQQTGLVLNSQALLISYQGTLTPLGPMPSSFRCKVVGIFESGLFDLDSQWAFTALPFSQKILDLSDVVNTIELKLDDIYQARDVARKVEDITGTKLMATTWMEQNRALLNALKMEKIVSLITVGLIELVAALNILVTLVMMVMEKNRDIAILMSMGARREQIQRIFVFQGLLIGLVGSIVGAALGYIVCFFADKYHLLKLDEEVYALSYVPFQVNWLDGLWVCGIALLISLLATLHPSRTASRIVPAEALRYE